MSEFSLYNYIIFTNYRYNLYSLGSGCVVLSCRKLVRFQLNSNRDVNAFLMEGFWGLSLIAPMEFQPLLHFIIILCTSVLAYPPKHIEELRL